MAGQRSIFDTICKMRGRSWNMNTAMTQNTPGRRADLNPFTVGMILEATAAAPQDIKAVRERMRATEREADAEYGCVDWYQYHDPADEDKVRQAFCAAQAVMDQYTGGAGLKSE
jgi:hypothetical protein